LRFVSILWLLMLGASMGVAAQDALVAIPSRPGVTTSYWWMPRDHAQATVLLFSGGEGGIGLRDGAPQSGNFLIRSRDAFAKVPMNVALIGNPSDAKKLSHAFRQSPEHLADVQATITDVLKRSAVPIWLVGTSQGTISAAAGAIAFGDARTQGLQIAGIVLSASVTGAQEGGALPGLALDRITVPVLLYHHQRDACSITTPSAAKQLLGALTSATVKKYWEVDGGANPSGNPCGALHYHGFIGMEALAVQQITEWVLSPTP